MPPIDSTARGRAERIPVRHLVLGGLFAAGASLGLRAPDPPTAPVLVPADPAETSPDERALEELRRVQDRVQGLLPDLSRATVGVRVGTSHGSGVIVSPDGYVLTAAHVIHEPGRTASILTADGRRLRGRTLGMHLGIDSGLIKIDADGPLPFVPMEEAEELEGGSWVVALGHPGGFERGRPPVLRVGRVSRADKRAVQTDCKIVSGDSGGPLFNLHGRVVGVHLSYQGNPNNNFHLPVSSYLRTWDHLSAGLAWGEPGTTRPRLGIEAATTFGGCRVTQVRDGHPAQRAGLEVNDVIESIDGESIQSVAELVFLLWEKTPGESVDLEVRRAGEPLQLEVPLGEGDS